MLRGVDYVPYGQLSTARFPPLQKGASRFSHSAQVVVCVAPAVIVHCCRPFGHLAAPGDIAPKSESAGTAGQSMNMALTSTRTACVGGAFAFALLAAASVSGQSLTAPTSSESVP